MWATGSQASIVEYIFLTQRAYSIRGSSFSYGGGIYQALFEVHALADRNTFEVSV